MPGAHEASTFGTRRAGTEGFPKAATTPGLCTPAAGAGGKGQVARGAGEGEDTSGTVFRSGRAGYRIFA